jgi:transcription elongation GreA/GreB family factor
MLRGARLASVRDCAYRGEIPMTPSEKLALHSELVTTLEAERDTLLAAQRATAGGVTHAESKADSDKDTRAIEASYLARGQGQRVESLILDVQRLASMKLRAFDADTPVALSAVVTLHNDEGQPSVVYLAAAGGGTALAAGDVSVITPGSPLGRVLIGATAGDVVQLARGGTSRAFEVVRVA